MESTEIATIVEKLIAKGGDEHELRFWATVALFLEEAQYEELLQNLRNELAELESL